MSRGYGQEQVEQEAQKRSAKQIIDIEIKGNLVRFFLGENGKQWGDDWDDAPYEHNCGTVYDEYVTGTYDMAFPWDCRLEEQADAVINSQYCRKDFMDRKVAALTITDKFDKIHNFYFGDDMNAILKIGRLCGGMCMGGNTYEK